MLRASEKRRQAVLKELARRIMNYMYNNHRDVLRCSEEGTPKKSMFAFIDRDRKINIEFSYTQNTLNSQGDFYEGIISSVIVDGRQALFNNRIWIYYKEQSQSHCEQDSRFLHNEYVVFVDYVTNEFIRTDVGQLILKEVLRV
jgi:hypothetical protein